MGQLIGSPMAVPDRSRFGDAESRLGVAFGSVAVPFVPLSPRADDERGEVLMAAGFDGRMAQLWNLPEDAEMPVAGKKKEEESELSSFVFGSVFGERFV